MIVEIVIPHQSRWDLLSRLLSSLERQTIRPDVCVVDNASTDESLVELAKLADIRVIASDVNLGFGRAVNEGVRTSAAEYVITLNNDMVAEPEFVEEMLRELQAGPDVAVAALQLGTAGLIDTVGVAIDQSLCAYDVGYGRAPSELRDETLTPIGPSGGAAGYRRSTFLRFGGYDENIFAYLEDADLAIRMRAGGVNYRFAERARVIHRHSATLGSGSSKKNQLMGWSRGYLLYKYGRRIPARAKLRGFVIDVVVYGGQALVDRNFGAIKGRRLARSQRRGFPREDLALSTDNMSLTAALRRRISRR